MVRTYKKTTNRGHYGNNNLSDALAAIARGESVNSVSKNYNIPCRTLRRHRDGKVLQPGIVNLGRHVQVLSRDIELELHDHIQTMERSMYGLTAKDVRHLAYEIAEAYNLKHPFNKLTKLAGKDWLKGFFARFPDLSIRIPQGTNLSRAIGFNKPKVQQFFTLYKQILEQRQFLPSQIWNMDETGITNVHKPGKIIASKGVKQVSKMTSGERGSTVTVICAMSSAGTYLPPMMIFPRKRMVDALMIGAPPQSLGCCSDSGWTDGSLFIKWLEHFVQFTNASPVAQHIVIMDGHHSHKTIAAINFAREHGIHLITLPPHSTHKMQPLDRTYFKSLKNAYNSAADSWMVSNPGKRISFFNMAGLFGQAFTRSATADKAIKGFQVCGLWPFDENIFSEEDFTAARVTEEDQPHMETAVNLPETNVTTEFDETATVAETSVTTEVNETATVGATNVAIESNQPGTSAATSVDQHSTAEDQSENGNNRIQSTPARGWSSSKLHVERWVAYLNIRSL